MKLHCLEKARRVDGYNQSKSSHEGYAGQAMKTVYDRSGKPAGHGDQRSHEEQMITSSKWKPVAELEDK